MRTTISSRGKLTLPAKIRQADEIEAGQQFELLRLAREVHRIERILRFRRAIAWRA